MEHISKPIRALFERGGLPFSMQAIGGPYVGRIFRWDPGRRAYYCREEGIVVWAGYARTRIGTEFKALEEQMALL